MTRGGEMTLRLLLEPIAAFLKDPATTEIVMQRPGEIGVERGSAWTWHDVPAFDFDTLDAIATLAAAMSQQDVGPDRPLCASFLPDGERIQICRPPAVAAGTVSLTIRRPPAFTPSLDGMAANGLFAPTSLARPKISEHDSALADMARARDWTRFFPLAVRARKTIVVTGATGSGKTTVAKMLLRLVPEDERLITIEDTAELVGLPHRNRVGLYYSKGGQGIAQTRPEDLIEAALRMRPDRVMLGEMRGGEAFAFIRGIAAGHPGSISTCHAKDAAGGYDALRLMLKQHEAGRQLADADATMLLRGLVDVVVHCAQMQDGRRVVEEVSFNPGVS